MQVFTKLENTHIEVLIFYYTSQIIDDQNLIISMKGMIVVMIMKVFVDVMSQPS